MRATGIIRRIDDLGRIVIPKEIRRTLRLREGDPMELFVEHDAVMFKPYQAIDNYKAEFETACRLLRWQGVNHYAVFDQRNRVSDYNLETVDHPESRWFDLRHPTFDQTSGLWVYAVLADGEVMGFIVCDHEDKHIDLVVKYLADAMSERP